MAYYDKTIRDYLIKYAKIGRTINYGDLNNNLDLHYDLSLSYERHELGEQLGDISLHEHEEGRPLLSSIVISTDGVSGVGFFEMAEELLLFDPTKTTKKKFLEQEQKKVFEYWKNHND